LAELVDYSGLNPYQSLEVVVANSPQELVDELKKIKTPIKIVQIVQLGTKSAAYIMGDVRPLPKRK
jgi:branched-subunit amino acid permease